MSPSGSEPDASNRARRVAVTPLQPDRSARVVLPVLALLALLVAAQL